VVQERSAGGHTLTTDVVFECPDVECGRLFLAHYESGWDSLLGVVGSSEYHSVSPRLHVVREFEESVRAISPSFVVIWGEAEAAEAHGLTEVCGIGYRKALEFLLKDYVCGKSSDDDAKEKIRRKFLGKLIDDDIDDPRVKGCARRATWLGNDEAHYVRRWDGKGVRELKMLIDLTLHWIEAEHLTAQFEQDMPEPGK
jgi:hypothetical protein